MAKSFVSSNRLIDKNIAVVAHDAGAANLILGFTLNNISNYYFYLKGPALEIFSSKYKNFKNSDLKSILSKCEILISGTGWQTDFEHTCRQQFKEKNKKVISVIDHWVNYKERFKYEKEEFLSDEIWVFDGHALEIATNEFPNKNIILQDNFYINDVLKKMKLIKKEDANSIVYILEPIRNKSERIIGNEFDCIDLFFKNIHLLNISFKDIIFKPHPSEDKYKYDDFLKKYIKKFNIKIDKKSSIESLIAKSIAVAGYGSMGLYIASLAGKKIISTRLQGHKKFSLPIQNYIEIKR